MYRQEHVPFKYNLIKFRYENRRNPLIKRQAVS